MFFIMRPIETFLIVLKRFDGRFQNNGRFLEGRVTEQRAQPCLRDDTLANAGMQIAVSAQRSGRIVQMNDRQALDADTLLDIGKHAFYLISAAEIIASPPEMG